MNNTIAYVTHEGTINVVDSKLDMVKSIRQPDMLLSWPTFLQNNEGIIFSGTRTFPGKNAEDVNALYLLNLKKDQIPRLVYINESDTGMISTDTPHYVLGSPDSSKVAFISQTIEGGMSLFVKVENSSNLVKIIDGAPIYFSWSADSNYLMAHVSDSYYLANVSNGDVVKLDGDSSLCMCPMWSPVNDYCLLGIDSENDKQRIGLVDYEGQFSNIMDVDGSATFIWDPSGKYFALAENLDNDRGYYNNTSIIDTNGFSKEVLISDPLLCMFWSPKGDQICYVTLSENGYGSLRFGVCDFNGNIIYLPDFKPSQMQLISYMFFDQYSMSHSPWSADGGRIIFSGLLGYESERTPLPNDEEVDVYQVEISSPNYAQKIDRGTFGVWRR